MFVEEKTQGEVTPAKLDEASTLILKAAALLEERGWCQDSFQSGESFCLVGALQFAAVGKAGEGIGDGSEPFLHACKRLERSIVPDSFCHIPSWNDRQGRTKDEVVSKLRAVALGL